MGHDGSMADVQFEVIHEFDAPARVVWDELIDWKGHEAWIPMTKVEVDPGDPTAVGATFTATTGVGPLGMPDRMRVVRCDWDDGTQSGDCVVEKLGPVLLGQAGFTVEPTATGSELRWFEDVNVKWAPGFLAPLLARGGAAGFRFGMRKLAAQLEATTPA